VAFLIIKLDFVYFEKKQCQQKTYRNDYTPEFYNIALKKHCLKTLSHAISTVARSRKSIIKRPSKNGQSRA